MPAGPGPLAGVACDASGRGWLLTLPKGGGPASPMGAAIAVKPCVISWAAPLLALRRVSRVRSSFPPVYVTWGHLQPGGGGAFAGDHRHHDDDHGHGSVAHAKLSHYMSPGGLRFSALLGVGATSCFHDDLRRTKLVSERPRHIRVKHYNSVSPPFLYKPTSNIRYEERGL